MLEKRRLVFAAAKLFVDIVVLPGTSDTISNWRPIVIQRDKLLNTFNGLCFNSAHNRSLYIIYIKGIVIDIFLNLVQTYIYFYEPCHQACNCIYPSLSSSVTL